MKNYKKNTVDIPLFRGLLHRFFGGEEGAVFRLMRGESKVGTKRAVQETVAF